MRKIQIGLLILILGLALVVQGCSISSTSDGPGGGTNDPTPTPVPGESGVIHVSTSITAPTTWTNDNLYILDKGIFVKAALNIEPGTIIKFQLNTYISVDSTGLIIANGAANDPINPAPITFTSIRDDSIGGDTNGDGTLTSPAKGNWMDIKVAGSGSLFNYCRFSYGGSGGYEYDALVETTLTAAVTYTNCTFSHSQNSGLSLRSGSATSTVSGNTFFDTTKPLWLPCAINVDDSNVFHNPDLLTQGNAYNAIWIDGGTIRSSAGWGETEVPFVLKGGISIEAGDTLTLQPGVIIKTTTGSINATGNIVAIGTPTNRITFTSYKDDSVGGDTDNVAGEAGHGDWGKLYFGANGSNLTYCNIFYGGSGTLPICAIQSGTTTIDHC
ncbi:MAG TPA: hypothetical protein VHY08_19300, partial [Bacillota bacterium]|nr:hypothetical protein [Bacillota bacterium]